MTIIFLNPINGKLYICTENEPTKIVDPSDPDVLKYIPNDDILYVENGHIIQKDVFATWLESGVDTTPRKLFKQDFDAGFRLKDNAPVQQQSFCPPGDPNRLYIHPVHNGTVIIGDIVNDRFPEGIQLTGKYHCIPIDEIGEENLSESRHFKVLLAKGKVEVVNENFVKRNAHKNKKRSAADAALDAILIKDDRHGAANRVARSSDMFWGESGESGGHGPGDAIPIFVE